MEWPELERQTAWARGVGVLQATLEGQLELGWARGLGLTVVALGCPLECLDSALLCTAKVERNVNKWCLPVSPFDSAGVPAVPHVWRTLEG